MIVSNYNHGERVWELTSVRLLANEVLNRAFVGRSHGLLGNRATAVIEALRLIHGTLESIALPSEHVVRVRTIPLFQPKIVSAIHRHTQDQLFRVIWRL